MRGGGPPLSPDLLILDFMTPKRDGASAPAEIGPEFPDLPVLMVTAYLEDVRDVADALGARCFVKSDFLEHADLLAEFTGIEPWPGPSSCSRDPRRCRSMPSRSRNVCSYKGVP